MGLSIPRVAVTGTALLAALVGWLPTPARAQQPRGGTASPAGQPVYVIGDTWSRSDGDWTLSRIENDRYVYTTGGASEFHLTRDLAVARVVVDGTVTLSLEPPAVLRWPLKPGASGVNNTILSPPPHVPVSNSGGDSQLTWKVAAEEMITVAGGAIASMPIAYNIYARAPSGMLSVGSFTVWYAPSARRIVKATSAIRGLTFELTGPPAVMAAAPPAPAPAPAPPASAPSPAPALPRPPSPTAKPTTPPEIAVLEPSTTTPLRGDAVALKIEVKSASRLKTLTIHGKGLDRSVTPEAGLAPGTPWRVAISVPLSEGSNVIRLEAVDEHGNRAVEVATLTRQSLVGLELVGPPQASVRGDQAAHALNARGRVRVELPPGTYEVEASKDGFVPARATVTLKPGQGTVEQRLAMAPVVAPTLRVLAPKPGTVQRGGDAKLRVEVQSPYRVQSLRVGRERDSALQLFTPAAGAKAGEPWLVETLVTLVEGNNAIRLEVVDEHGIRSEQTLTLVRESAVAVEKPPAPPAPPPVAALPPTDTEPPKIAINYPPPEARVDREQITVLGLVTDNAELDRVLVSVNGTLLTAGGERATGKSHSIRTPVTLQPGENVIEVTAIDRAGNAVQSIRTITRAVPAVATPVPSIGNRWAVVIGVGKYESAAIPSLRYTVADAEAMYRTLIGPAGFKKDNVLLLTDRSERKPTLKNIKYALGTFLARSAQKDDTVLIYFAGHGAPETDQRGLERDGLAKYLIPSDADPDDLYSTALPMDELQTIFGRLESERVVAFLDACYSGAAGGRTFAARKTRAGGVDDLFLERLTRSKGRAIITASRPAEVSIELPELGHGIFTHYLVEGLKGAADGNRDGIVTLQELYEYVESQVSRKSRSVGGNQHPVMKGELEGVLPLTRVGR